MAEYALRDVHKPIGISDYELGKSIPQDIKSGLPSIEELKVDFIRDYRTMKIQSNLGAVVYRRKNTPRSPICSIFVVFIAWNTYSDIPSATSPRAV